MADLYGERGKNTFKTDKNIGRAEEYANTTGYILNPNTYSLTITSEKTGNPGKITIYRQAPGQNEASEAEEIGTIDQNGKFTPGSNANEFEKFHFNQPEAIKNVRNNAVNTVKVSIPDEVGPIEREARIQETVFGTIPTDEIREQIAQEQLKNVNATPVTIPQIGITGISRDNYDNYFYPLNLKEFRGQDRIKFTMKIPKGTEVDPFFYKNNKQFKRTYKEITGSVTLPIQPVISDKNTVDFAGLQLNAVDAALAGSAFNLIQSGSVEELVNNAGNIGNQLKQLLLGSESNNIQRGLQVFLAQQAAGVQGLLSRSESAVLNPNLELLFRGPQLRPFSFTFTLSPRNGPEAKQVKNIIRFFKQGMSVKTSTSNVFLKSPHVFDIKYQTFNEEGTEITHPSINLIKTCALVDCGVEYTPDGSYMTFNDPQKTMTSYKINLQFTELDPIYDKDYEDLKDPDVIGY